MPSRKNRNFRERERLFHLHGGACHLCGLPIDLRCEAYEIDHVTPFALTQDERDENLKPAHVACHKLKTHGRERQTIADADRKRAKHLGHWPKSTGNRRIPSRPFYNPRSAQR